MKAHAFLAPSLVEQTAKSVQELANHSTLHSRGLKAMLVRWNETIRSRQALAQLSPEQLEDIGLSAEQAKAEAARPFWDGGR
ncbi:MAG: DUF1127 domain-containing protein [Neomegalonema sp.]|nr:DUF1127 domain-containing protein [Neomegalonema sp.]